MAKLIDLTGEKFGRLTVIERAGTYRSKNSPYAPTSTWRCICDCGKETIVIRPNLVSGATKSCGCMRKSPRTRSEGTKYIPGEKIASIEQLAVQKRAFWKGDLIGSKIFLAWPLTFAINEIESGNVLEAR